jgi:hypothetical protein
MKTLEQLMHMITSHARFRGIEDVLQAEPWLSAYSGEDWKDYLSEENGACSSVVLLQNAYAKLTLICWDGHFRSPKHGHPDRGCLLKVLSGALVETRYDPIDPEKVIGKYHLYQGGMGFIHDALAYHVVENPSPQPAVSLHLYSPGIYTSRVIPAAPEQEHSHR